MYPLKVSSPGLLLSSYCALTDVSLKSYEQMPPDLPSKLPTENGIHLTKSSLL